MSRYIDADALLMELDMTEDLSAYDAVVFEEMVNAMPTADVVEVVRGEWINYCCSVCGYEPYNPSGMEKFNYCSNCGAEMRCKDED